MSHGRLLFGFGAGWYEHEWRAYGYGFPDIPTRMGMFRKACEIIHFVFLCSPRASYCVGSTYYIDGGWLRVTT